MNVLLNQIIDKLTRPFWFDEIATWWASQSLFHTDYPYRSHPAYYGLISLWRIVFGDSEFAMRFPSVAWLLVPAMSNIGQFTLLNRIPPNRMLSGLGVASIFFTIVVMSLLKESVSVSARPLLLLTGIFATCLLSLMCEYIRSVDVGGSTELLVLYFCNRTQCLPTI